jgi:hypothetical protein
MRRITLWRIGSASLSAIGSTLLMASVGCRTPARTVHYDLARDASLAEWGFPGGVTVVASPQLEVHPRRSRLAEQADDEGSANPRVESNLLVRWPAGA